MSETQSSNTSRTDIRSLWASLKRIFALATPYRYRLGLSVVLVLFSSAVWLTVPLGLRELLDAVFQDGNRGLLNALTLGLLGLFLLQAVFAFGGFYNLGWVGEKIVADLRKHLYGHLHEQSLRFFASRKLGEITSRLTNDVQSVRNAVTRSLVDLLNQGFSLIGSVALMVVLNWRMSLLVFFTVPVASLLARYFGGRIRRLSKKVQDELAETTAVAEEALGAVRVVKAFAREKYEVNRYATAVDNLFASARHRVLLETIFWSSTGMTFMIVMVVLFWFGGLEVLAERLSPGDLVAFIFYAMNVARSVGMMSRLYTTYNTAAGASERLFELLDTRPDLSDPEKPATVQHYEGSVRFDDVTFMYEKDSDVVLSDISFEIEAGTIVALVGPSGAGKTTLLHLIPRFYDPVSGAIRVDGQDVRDLNRTDLRSQTAVVPQDVHLFNTDIRENIRYGRLDATDDQIEEAAVAAHAHEFISSFPDGYDTQVGERGVKLSGGQKQRVAIARALLRDPKILLLDEATSALDSESERHVQAALEVLMQGRTTFIIAHRLSTVRHVDLILVLEKGRIVERGTHNHLYAQNGLYRRLAELQFENNHMLTD